MTTLLAQFSRSLGGDAHLSAARLARTAREQMGVKTFELLLDGVLLRVGHGRDSDVDGCPHHKSPLVEAAQATRLHLWRVRQTTQVGVGGHGPTGSERRSAPLCFVAHATHVSSTRLRREVSLEGVDTRPGRSPSYGLRRQESERRAGRLMQNLSFVIRPFTAATSFPIEMLKR